MMNNKHTPLPWKTGESKKDGLAYIRQIEFSGMGRTSIGFVDAPAASQTMISQADANAEFIVRACNAHYDLIDLLKTVQKETEDGNNITNGTYLDIVDKLKSLGLDPFSKAKGDQS